VSGSATAARDGTYLVQAAAANLITVGVGHDFAAVTGDDLTSVLSFWRKNREGILPGGWILIGLRNFVASQNLTLQANTAACNVAVSFLGT
jgi:hypothetical protein